MSVDLTSLVQCRNLYIDYYFKSNKAGTDESDIKLIEEKYSDYLSKWKSIGQGVEKDTNEYIIDDNDWNSAYDDGKSSAKDKTGYNGKNGGSIASSCANGALGITATGFSLLGGKLVAGATEKISANVVSKVTEQALNKALKEAAAKAAAEAAAKATTKQAAKEAAQEASKAVMENGAKGLTDAAKEGAKETGANAGSKVKDATWLISIPIELASAILALATDANGKEADALKELSGLMTESQGELYSAQAEMESTATEVAEKEQEILDINEDSSTQMIELQTKSNMYYSSYMRLKAKMDKGEELTAGEKALMKTFETNINNNNSTQTSLQATTEEMRTTAVGELGALTTTFDSAAETMANTQGMTDYGASFDKATKVLCWVTMAFDALNAGMAIKDGIRAGATAAPLLWAGAWIWAFVAMAAAAVVMSGIDGVHQYQHLKVANEEIGVRETTEQVNEGVAGTYDTDITEFDASMQSLEDMEVLELQKKTVPTATTVSSGNTNNGNTNTNTNNGGNNVTAGKIKTPKMQ